MLSSFLNLTALDVAARVQTVAAAAARGPVVVRVGDEVFGYRNVGVDLPRGRRSAAEGRLLRNRVWVALETAGVVMAETAGAPKVGGDMLGSVRVREVAANWGDASGLARPPPRSG
jgi:hypothetical protein